MTRLLFVCLGNICRSPTAEAVFHTRAANAGLEVEIDSAGTGAWHLGASPDARAQEAAAGRGYDLSALRARQVIAEDFERFDFLLAMDHDNLETLKARAPLHARDRVRLFLSFAPELACDAVPDPYYGDAYAFEEVLDLVEAASDGLIAHLKSQDAALRA